MEFKDIVMQRYATKKFDGRTIPREKINGLIEFIRYAPSAINMQPWRIKIVTDQGVKEPTQTGCIRPGTGDHLLASSRVLCRPRLRKPHPETVPAP